MHVGFTMFEKMHFDGGQVTNASLADYKIPGIRDLPGGHGKSLRSSNVQHNGPFGAKGVGEVATFCVSPAIANAIDDAVGVRLTELPLNPEAVYRAIRAKARQAAGGRRDMSAARTITFHAQRRAGHGRRRAAPQSGRAAADPVRPDRRARELRPGPVRLLHRARQRHAVSGCLYLALFVDGAEVATIEGLDTPTN